MKVKDLLQSDGWAILKKDLESQIDILNSEETLLHDRMASLIKEGKKTSDQVVIEMISIQSKKKGIYLIFELIDRHEKSLRSVQKKI